MSLANINDTYLAHLCGSYDFISPPKVFPQAATEYSLESVVEHEKAHQWLSEHSVYGLWLIVFRQQILLEEDLEKLDTLNQIVVALVANSIEVQEGFASYVEYYCDSTQYNSINEFKKILLKRPSYYLAGFETAQKMDVIFLDSSLSKWKGKQNTFLRRCLLLDICRFSMNVPLGFEQLSLLKNPKEDTLLPNTRFRSIMARLSSDHGLRSVFLEKTIHMMENWVYKFKTGFRDPSGKYAGVKYADNCEHIIAETFVDLPYIHPEDPAQSKYWNLGSRPQRPESVEDYLAKRECAEFKFSAQFPISFHPNAGNDELLDTLRTHLTCSSRGCYIRFFKPPDDGAKLLIDEGGKKSAISVTSDKSIAYFHLADFTLNDMGGRIWNYHTGGDAVVFDNRLFEEILSVLQYRDAAVVFDADLTLDDPFKSMEWARFGNHVYIISMTMGSISGLRKILHDQRLGVEGADIVVMRNWPHFMGAGNADLILIWFIPRGVENRVSILYAGTIELAGYLKLAAEREWLPAGFNFVIRPIIACGNIGRVKWLIGPPRGETLAPALADVVSSHMISFGW